MRLTDIVKPENRAEWEAKGYVMPAYDRAAMVERTRKDPTWIHFGAGNIFRAFPAAVLEGMLSRGEADKGVIVAEGFDYDIIDMAYRPYDDLSLLVVLKADGSIEKRVVGSVAESLKADTASVASDGDVHDHGEGILAVAGGRFVQPRGCGGSERARLKAADRHGQGDGSSVGALQSGGVSGHDVEHGQLLAQR